MGNDFGLFGKIYKKGEIICRQGDPGDEMYIIQSGAVEVSSRHDGRKVVLTILEKEEFFGEMALLSGGRRSADITALDYSRFAMLSGRDFHRFLRRYGLGIVRPQPLPWRPWKRRGYLKTGKSIPDLARACGIDPNGLTQTVGSGLTIDTAALVGLIRKYV